MCESKFMRKAIIVSLPILIITKVFGFIDWQALPRVPIPGFGSLWFSDVVLLVLLMVMLFYRPPAFKGTLFSLLLLFMGYIAFQVLRNFFVDEYSLQGILNGLRGVAYYATFFTFVMLIRNRQELHQTLVVIGVIALLSALATLMFYFGLLNTKVLLFGRVELPGYSVPNIYPAAEYLFDITFYVTLALALSDRVPARYKKFLYFAVVLIGLVSLVSFSRATISVLLGGSMLIILVVAKVRFYKLLPLLLVLVLGVLLLNYFMTEAFGTGLAALTARLNAGVSDVQLGTGSLQQRLEILRFKWQATTEYNFLIGRGFDWGPAGASINVDLNPYARSVHSGLASIYVVFGALGFVMFGLIFITVISKAISLYRNASSGIEQQVVLGILIFSIAINIKSVATDPYTDPTGAVVLAASWAIIAKLVQLQHLERAESAPVAAPLPPLRHSALAKKWRTNDALDLPR